MQVETRSRLIKKHVHSDLHGALLETTVGDYVTGCADLDERRIHLAPNDIISILRASWHEYGHIVGDDLSFKTGDVLSPEEVINTSVKLNLNELALLTWRKYINPEKQVTMSGTIKNIADKVLMAYTKGNFDLSSVEIYNISLDEIMALALNGKFEQVSTTTEGQLMFTREKWSRDFELSSTATELACLFILENTLRKYRIFAKTEGFFVPSEDDPSTGQQRAMAIALRSLRERSKTWAPSLVDLRAEERA